MIALDELIVFPLNLVNGQSIPTRQKTRPSKISPQQISDKAKYNKMLDENQIDISDDFWETFVLLAKVCYLRDREADLYDVFDTLRTKVLGGWEYTSDQLAKIDAQIAREEKKNGTIGTRLS